MDYTNLPAMVRFALADVEAGAHLARTEQASRMWRSVAAELRELSDTLGRELDGLQQHWNDAAGVDFVRQALRRKAAIDEMLTRIMEHQPWRALDDLARQLLLTRARVTDTVEQPTDEGHHDAAAHLTDLDRYFYAAAEAMLTAAGLDQDSVQLATPSAPAADYWTTAPDATAPTLAGNADPLVILEPLAGSPLPPGSVAIPGLIAIPSGSPRERNTTRRGTDVNPEAARSPAGGRAPGSGGAGTSAALPAASPHTSGADVPHRIPQAAKPVPITGPAGTPEAPQPPAHTSTSGAPPGGSRPATGPMSPPMMAMPPMVPGTAQTARRRSGTTRPLEEDERQTRTPPATPGVPPRLRGRSAVADPAHNIYRPATTSGTQHVPAPEVLDHEVWQVPNPGAASPLKPEPAAAEQPKRVLRPRN
ncbi:hypothetical protein [Amycolatopsis anabasis]|uniref:hypothetical protein n=1 Tax=Amycolatopsis anabasis TaxID=1840409 RepID=UPI00131E17FA|nr:hypothetical protein [Amycolatopsis anabasis]